MPASSSVFYHPASSFFHVFSPRDDPSSDLIDPDNPSIRWQVWFGGDVQGIDSWNPEIICLHVQASEADPHDAGLDTWELLIGRQETAKKLLMNSMI
jgi:hypothetical protein